MALPCEVWCGGNPDTDIHALLGRESISGSSTQGNLFIFTIPPNEVPNYDFGDVVTEIYVASAKPTKFRVFKGAQKELDSIYSINDSMGVVVIKRPYKDFEVRAEETVSGSQTIIIESESPLSIFAVNSKSTTTDGFMAIPVAAWGKSYIHCAYYDNNEGSGRNLAGGFIIMAAEDSTTVTISAKGVGGDADSTSKGHKIGDSWTITLNYGEYYMVRGSANFAGVFDLTGTSIKSNKAIGLISFHERTGMPRAVTDTRDCLNEMLPPISAWGREYVSLESYRGDAGKGDIFRVVASEPNTKLDISWYDDLSLKQIGKFDDIILKNAGDFFEYHNAPGRLQGTDQASIKGVAHFLADKPILVMQYAASGKWDGCTVPLDPNMVFVPPIEQFTSTAVFQVPSNNAFSSSRFNLIALGDSSNRANNLALLQSIKIDNKPVHSTFPKLLTNRLPGTNYYFVKGMLVKPGPHFISGNTKFVGYTYGRKNVDAYAWPGAMLMKNLAEMDTLPPLYNINSACSRFSIEFSELRNGKETDYPRQTESGVVDVPILLSGSFNFLQPAIPDSFSLWPPNFRNKFFLNVEDKTRDAKAVFAILDRHGNAAIDSVEYIAEKLVISPNQLDFGYVNIKLSDTITISIKNNNIAPTQIDSVTLKFGNSYKLLSPILGQTIAPGDSILCRFIYTPSGLSNTDRDTLLIHTNCLSFSFAITGKGGVPIINVEDFDAGMVFIGESLCNNAIGHENSINLKNTGNADLIIHGYNKDNTTAPFAEYLTNITFPIIIKSGETKKFEKVCFSPQSQGQFTTNVTFNSNANSGDSISVWSGLAVAPGVMLASKDWGDVRIKTTNSGEIELWNAGDSSVSLTGIKLETGAESKGFTFASPMITDMSGIALNPSVSAPIVISPSSAAAGTKRIKIKLNYAPDAEYGTTVFKVIPTFSVADNITEGSIFGMIKGTGVLPRIEARDIAFQGVIELNSTHDSTISISINSTSETAGLFIKELKLTGSAIEDFTFLPELNSIKNITLGKKAEANDKLTIDVHFTPKATGARRALLEVYNDAAPGPETSPIIVTPIRIVGNATTLGSEIAGVDFGTVSRCDMPEKKILVTNTASEVLTLDTIIIPNEYIDELIPVDFVRGKVVNPGETDSIGIRFVAGQRLLDDGAFAAPINIGATQIGTHVELVATVTGNTKSNLVKVSLPTLTGILPGESTATTGNEFPISLELLSGSWSDANITDIKIEIRLNRQWFKFDDEITKGDVPQDWSFSGKLDSNSLIIEGHGQTPLNSANTIVL